jgi:hypothetical protein
MLVADLIRYHGMTSAKYLIVHELPNTIKLTIN